MKLSSRTTVASAAALPKVLCAGALIVAFLLAIGCSKSGRGGFGSSKNDGKITGSPKDAPVTLQGQWGLSNRYIFRSEMTISQQLPRQNRNRTEPQENTLGLDYAINVANVSPNGGRTLVLEITGVQFDSIMGETPLISYDSQNKVVGTDGNIMAERLEKIIGSKITFQVSASNRISNVKGIPEIMSTLYTGGTARAEGLVRRLFTQQYLRHLVDVIVLPSDPIRVNDTWPGQVAVNSGPLTGPLTADVTYTFRGWQVHDQHKCALLEFKGTVKARGANSPSKAISNFSIEKGEINGKTWFDPELGMMVDSVSDQAVTSKGTIRWKRAPTNAPPQDFTSEIRQHSDVKLVDVETAKPAS